MSDWYSTGYEQAEKMQGESVRKSRKNFWTKPGESAVLRFLAPAKDSFNYKRAYVPSARGQKYFTSPGSHPDPFVEKGLTLQSTFAWKVIDRRILTFEVQEEGRTAEKTIGPRMLYFADGQRTRKSLIAFENQIREDINEQRKEDGLPAFTAEEFNLSSFDVKVVKEKGAPWQFFAVRGGQPKALSAEDKKLVEEGDFDLREELRPAELGVIRTLLANVNSGAAQPAAAGASSSEDTYSYGTDTEEEEVGNFFS